MDLYDKLLIVHQEIAHSLRDWDVEKDYVESIFELLSDDYGIDPSLSIRIAKTLVDMLAGKPYIKH